MQSECRTMLEYVQKFVQAFEFGSSIDNGVLLHWFQSPILIILMQQAPPLQYSNKNLEDISPLSKIVVAH